jgi:hypothetical protein
MKRLALAIMVVASIPGWSALMAQLDPPRVTAEFPGASLKRIHVAEAEFQRQKLDLDKYTVSVAEQSESVIVGLTSLDNVAGARGSTGTHPGYVVEISRKDLKIVRSNYIR